MNWDDALPLDLEESWTKWLSSSIALGEIEIARCTREPTEGKLSKDVICIFSDASENGYSASSYRVTGSTSDPDNLHVTFLQAKTKVAPLKALSIPRLELLAAELAMNLFLEIRADLPMFFVKPI